MPYRDQYIEDPVAEIASLGCAVLERESDIVESTGRRPHYVQRGTEHRLGRGEPSSIPARAKANPNDTQFKTKANVIPDKLPTGEISAMKRHTEEQFISVLVPFQKCM